MLECWNAGMLECWNAGMLECWNAGMLECWNAGMLECWNAGKSKAIFHEVKVKSYLTTEETESAEVKIKTLQ
ncbi:hypothetical protein ACLKMH_14415 [Psychromonas sp. KJ10-10]